MTLIYSSEVSTNTPNYKSKNHKNAKTIKWYLYNTSLELKISYKLYLAQN